MPGIKLFGYDATNKKWIPLEVDADGLVKVDMSAINLNDLADVSVAAPADDNLFYYDDATGLWKSRKLVDADIPTTIARDTEVTADIATHAALPSVHHTKFTTTEHDVVARHPLANLDPLVCSEAEADAKIAAHHDTIIKDADADTAVEVEKNADEDKIRMKVAGIESFLLETIGTLTLVKQSAAIVYLSADQVVATNSPTQINFDTEELDVQNEFNTATHVFTVKVAGKYYVCLNIAITDAIDATRYNPNIRKNSVNLWPSNYHASHSGYLVGSVTGLVNVAVNDTIDFTLWHNKGSNANLRSGSNWTKASICKIA